MKQFLLFFVFILFTSVSYGQLASNDAFASNIAQAAKDIDLKVYPNPATTFINFNNFTGQIDQVVFFNLVGRPIKRFQAVEGRNQYDLTELSRGLYLVQLMDRKGNVISTKRLNKR